MIRLIRFLDVTDNEGETPLMLAAKLRNASMCRTILSLGANPNTLSVTKRRTAAFMARDLGFTVLADWLDTKISAGVARVETFADAQFEKKLRGTGLLLMDLQSNFCKDFLKLIQGSSSVVFFGSPSVPKMDIEFKGVSSLREQEELVNK